MKIICKIIVITGFLIVSHSSFANEELILQSDTAFNPTFINRFSMLLGVNPSLIKASDVSNMTLAYSKKMDEYWFDTSLLIMNGLFNKITTNNQAATGLTAANLQDSKSSMTSFGIGFARETKYIQTLFPFSGLYEFSAADLTYSVFKEKNSGKNFSGPGMNARFSANKRFSDYVSLGGQFIYSLAVVKRALENDTENSSARSLTISHASVGLELTFFL